MKTSETGIDKAIDTLPVMEAFLTLQGEGAYAGSVAYFIRLGGCDVGCVWCDVKASWDAGSHPRVHVEDLVNSAVASGAAIVVVTGGEPFMYDLTSFTISLKKQGLKVHVETAGVYPITGSWDWITFSPKKFKAPIADYYHRSDELKVVVFNKSDYQWAEEHSKHCVPEMGRYLQVEWSKRDKLYESTIEYIKANPKWKMSVQTHKYLNIP